MTEKTRSISISGTGTGSYSTDATTSTGAASGSATHMAASTSGISGPITLISEPMPFAPMSSSSPAATSNVMTAASSANDSSSGGHHHHQHHHVGAGFSGPSGGNTSGTESESELGHDLITGTGGDCNSIMNSSQISTASNDSVSITKMNLNITHNIAGSSCRFPKLEECAHFHYERVQLGALSVRLVDDRSDLLNSSIASQSISGDVGGANSISGPLSHQLNTHSSQGRSFNPSNCWFIMKVIASRSDPFLIKRSFDNACLLDEMLHRCVYDRKISGLRELGHLDFKTEEEVEYAVAKYLERFSKIASDSLTCGTVLTWLQLDNKGRRLPLADGETMRSINTPAVGAAYGVRRYVAQACDEISIEVGDMISVIDMPSPAESVWWRGKKSHLQKSHYEVGFFPQSCVATIGDKVPRHLQLPAPLVGQLDVSPTKPVLRKHGKLIAFFRSFILSRPSRRRLKQSGIYRERVFSCDLSEHLLNSGQEIPMVLKCCTEFIEENGIVDGIYRLSGITSNIQKLRRAFDEERVPDLNHPEIKQDIHAVSSLLKMYFRELPNPLCTYQLYGNFVEAIKTRSDTAEQLRLMKETVLKLPPPHYRTLKYLATHLNKISRHSANTGMTDKNLAIVWAPNLLRSPELEMGGVDALRGVGVQAVVTEYLIKNCHLIFDPNEEYNRNAGDQRLDSLTDCESLLVEQREHDQSLSIIERPKSLSAGGAKLISLEEAQERHSRVDGIDPNKSIPINVPPSNIGSYIEVGGGPSSLPDKYHTVLTVPRSWQKRKTNSWKSLFTRNTKNSNSNNDIKSLHVSSPVQKEPEVSPPFSESIDNDLDKIHSPTVNGQTQPKPKSIDLFDGSKTMDVCVRSNSIDSLRTAGHSRSVSHDSYFDLLQSPLRAVPTCPSRELSELGLNFDREEPEMKIFSESESLVSSPKVGKENIPPSRRVMRARPEEFSSATNSVNPSPKKQPRLNLLSPGDPPSNPWPTVAEELQTDESCCKRYKLEDQLPDIQFIDCSTPEHTILNSNTVYTSVQVHNPPSSMSKSSSYNEDLGGTDPGKKTDANSGNFINALFEGGDSVAVAARYSYPIMQAGSKRKDNDPVLKERFSYPGSGSNRESKYMCRMPNVTDVKMNIAEEEKKDNVDYTRSTYSHKFDKAKNRYSYCEPSSISADVQRSPLSFILRSSSADLVKNKADMERSKLSVATPSSPMQSPRYSLLVGETSSENSSAVNTPVYEMDVVGSQMIDRIGNGRSNASGCADDENCTSNNGQNCGIRNFDTKDFSFIVSEDSCSNLNSQLSQNTSDKRDISALKRELSLDLEGGASKMSVDLTDMSLSSNNKQIINIPSSPNNSNFTHTSDNTSQSITPSEFGYQHLNRPSNTVSLENSPKFDGYETMEHAFINYEKPPMHQNSPSKTKAGSPIKATINITYNLRSPVRKTFATSDSCKDDYEPVNVMDSTKNASKPLLETSFDENMVYEQVKFFKSSVSEVNQMLNNGNNEYSDIKLKAEPQRVPDLTKDLGRNSMGEVNSNLIVDDPLTPKADFHLSDDVLMSDNLDSLEIDQNCSLYENVELRKPPNLYENVKMSPKSLKPASDSRSHSAPVASSNLQRSLPVEPGRDSAPNFSVRQLATKFETSPVDQTAPFDFSHRGSKRSDPSVMVVNRDAPCYVRAKNNSKQLNKSAQITRSLDENAFVREFGNRRFENVTKSVQQIEKIDDMRRKSFDFGGPKSLNPPKHLPELPDSEVVELCKTTSGKYPSSKLKLDLEKVDEATVKPADVKITPTTENRISLIQNNVDIKAIVGSGGTEEDRNPTMKVLSGCKLDRERIERIKEERRLQLNEKYRSESFKSKSKTELREFIREEKQQSESLRVKSKSRGDVRSLQKDIDNLQSCESLMFPSSRIRRSSDEKNQNNVQEAAKSAGVVIAQIDESSTKGGSNQQQKVVEKKTNASGTLEYQRDREISELRSQPITRGTTVNSTREKISPPFSIRDVAAMFESRSQNQ